MSTRSTAIARGVGLQVLAKVSVLPLAMVTLGIATRYLGPQDYGLLATAVVFVTSFEAFSELGVGTIVVRRVAGRGGNLERLVGQSLAFSSVYALPLALVAGVVGIGVYWGDTEQQLAVAVLAVGLVATTHANCFDPVFDVKVRYSAAASAEFFSRVLTLSAAAAVAFFDLGLLGMCAVQIIPQTLRLVVQWWGARRLTTIRWVPDAAGIKSLLKESLPLTVISIIGVAYWRADGLILSVLAPPEQIGGYYLAVQIAFTLTLVSRVFSRSVLSTISETYASDRVRFGRAVDQGYRFLLLVGVPIAVVGWPLAGRMAQVVGSEEFRPFAGPPLQLFFVAVGMTFLSAIVSDGLIAAHEQRYLTTMSSINLGINIVGNIVLIPFLGAVACGIMMVVTETIGVGASQWRLRRHGAHPLPFGYLARLVPAGLLSLGAIWLTYDLPLVVPMIAGGLAYVAGAFAMGAVPPALRAAMFGALRPKSLDRMEAESGGATGSPPATGTTDVAGVSEEPGAEAVPSGPGPGPLPHPVSPGAALDAETAVLDLASLQTVRFRATGDKYVEMRIIRRP